MSALQTEITGTIVAAITGAPDVGVVIRGALAEILAQMSGDAATVAIEYGALETANGQNGQVVMGRFDGTLDVFLDLYWSGPPAVWEDRIYECSTEIWRRMMAIALPAASGRVVRVIPLGHDRPDVNTEGDNQHVVLRCNYRLDVRHSITDPEA